MKFIAHRGNLYGPSPNENKPSHVDFALRAGVDAEVDVWRADDVLYLGHDCPQYEIDETFLKQRRNRLWCHAKNKDALEWLLEHDYHVFYHDTDEYTLTSKGYVWSYPGAWVPKGGVCVMPERVRNPEEYIKKQVSIFAICSDYVKYCS